MGGRAFCAHGRIDGQHGGDRSDHSSTGRGANRRPSRKDGEALHEEGPDDAPTHAIRTRGPKPEYGGDDTEKDGCGKYQRHSHGAAFWPCCSLADLRQSQMKGTWSRRCRQVSTP